MKRSGNPLRYPMHVLRGKATQPAFWALVFLGPLLDVFRVDMIRGHMLFMGRAYDFAWDTLMWIPIVFYGAVLVIAVVSFIWGRLFCGWTCPHNTLTEWTRPLRAMVGLEAKPRWMKLLTNRNPGLEHWLAMLSPALAIPLTFGLAVLLTFYIVPPDWVALQYATGKPHIALVFGNGLFTLIGLFLLYTGHNFCRTCCPYGLAQSVSAYHENSRWRPMEIAFSGDKTDDCKSCTVCRQVCPVDIDPRDPENLKVGQFDGCFNCGECIDACSFIHSFKRGHSLLAFANPGFRPKSVPAAEPASSPAPELTKV